MSDVSGIPYMGPQGVGNLYAPLFPASGMSTPSASQISYNWAPQGAYGQNVIDNLYSSGGGFGKQTDYYSQLGANYSAAGMSPWGLFTDAGTMSTGRGAGGAAFPISYNTGYNTGGMGGGGGGALSVNDPSVDWTHLFSGGSGGSAPSISMPSSQSGFDWTHLFGGGGGGAQQSQQMQQPSNFGSLFGQGAGGMYASRPSSEDQTAGWGNAPTAMPSSQKLLGYEPQQWPEPQQQPTNYGSLFGQGVGGSATDQRAGENTVADPNRATYGGYGQGGATSALPGYMADNNLPSDLRPSAAPEPGSRSYDFAPMFEAGGGGGLGTGGAESQLFGGREGSLGGSAFNYNPYATETQPSADDMAAQARARLADLVTGAPDKVAEETAKTVEAPVVADDQAVPLPRERPAGADAPRPPGDIPPQDLTYLQGKGPGDLKGVNKQFAKAMQEFAREYNASQGDYSMALRSGLRSAGQGFHTSGEALDTNLIDRRTGERLNDYQTRDPVVFKAYQDNANAFHTFLEKNYPDLAEAHRWGGYFWNGGPGHYGSQDIMHHDLGGDRIGMGAGSWKGGLSQQAADAYGLPTGGGYNTPWPKFTFDWSNAPIKDAQPIQQTYKSADGTSLYQIAPDGSHIPVPIGKGMNETTEYDPFRGTSTFTAPPIEQRPGVNQGQDITPPPANIPADLLPSAGGFNAIDAAATPAVPKGPSGVEKAQTFLNRPVESILQQYAPQHLTAAGFALDIKQPLREALKGPLGGQILEGLQPRVGELGLTRTDLAKAIANPAARFGGDFGTSGGDELPTPGAFTPYPGFRESANFENRSGETPGFFSGLADTAVNKGRDIADLFSSQPEPDAMSRALGFEDIMTTPFTPETETAPEIAAAPPTRADLAAAVSAPNNGFSRYSDEGYGTSTGRSPPVTLSPEHMRTMEEIESHQNPRLHDPGSSYKGLYQLSDKEFRKYGGTGSIFDAEQNTKAASAKMYAEGQRAQDILGRELSPVEQYMVHQQGLAGTLSHLANPDQPAWKSFQQASQWSDARAKTAIWGNLSNNQKAQFGNDVNSITSRDFINLWTTMYYQKMVESGLSPGGLSDLPR